MHVLANELNERRYLCRDRPLDPPSRSDILTWKGETTAKTKEVTRWRAKWWLTKHCCMRRGM